MQATLEDYRVELDYFSGPLDLLLFLVRKNEIDLHDIPIAELTEQYLQHLEEIKTIDVNLASEFLVMAATLLEIKSHMLAPKLETSEGEGDEAAKTGDALAGFGGDGASGPSGGGGGMNPLDPRYELVQQLLAYKRLKDCAMELDERREEWDARFPHKPAKLVRGTPAWMSDGGGDSDDFTAESTGEALEFDLEDVSINDLVEAFSRILESIGQTPAMHAVTYDDTPISVHADDLVDRLTREGPLTLQSVFVNKRTRSEMIGLFLATLELVKLKKVRVTQDRIVGEIKLELRPIEEQLRAADDKPTDWKDPVTGEMQYEWPSEAAKERAEKRATRRFNRMGKGLKPDDEHDPADGSTPFIVINKDSLEEMLESHTPKPAPAAEAADGSEPPPPEGGACELPAASATTAAAADIANIVDIATISSPATISNPSGSESVADPIASLADARGSDQPAAEACTRIAALAPLTDSATAEILREAPEDEVPAALDTPLTSCAAASERIEPETGDIGASVSASRFETIDEVKPAATAEGLTPHNSDVAQEPDGGHPGQSPGLTDEVEQPTAENEQPIDEADQPRLIPWRRGEHQPVAMIPLEPPDSPAPT